jgi:beta-galactosidase
VRSTLSPGTITVSASRRGLKSAQVQIEAKFVQFADGLSTLVPQRLPGPTEE